ncbi:MAG: diversity-generating retroelement protein Avd [Patescibacteria group bacterium]
MLDDLIIYQKTYDFLLWLHPVINKFPKSQRFVLGQRIENKTLDLLRSMSIANAEREKIVVLHRASVELDELRILIRLSKDLHFINIKQYGVAAEKMNEIGRLLSGWARSQHIVNK